MNATSSNYGRDHTVRLMAPHLTHAGVHDHGFNNVSTYGSLLRLMHEGRIRGESPGSAGFYELALKCSGAVQAMRWSRIGRWRRLHLFVQRAAFAVRGYHPLAARAGGQPSAGPRADGRKRSAHLAARSADPTCRSDRALLGLLRRRARHIRRPRAHRAREHLQHERRELPVPEFAAGLFAVQHMDARAGMGDVRVCGATGILRHAARTSPNAGATEAIDARAPPKPPATSISTTRRRMAFLTGTPARRNCYRLGDWASRPSDPFNPLGAGRQFGGGDRGAGSAAARAAI